MAVGYRAVLSVGPSDNAVKIARESVHAWLVDKIKRGRTDLQEQVRSLDFDTPFSVQIGPSIHISNTPAQNSGGQLQQVMRLDDTSTPGATWRVNITAHRQASSTRREQAIMVELDPLHLDADHAVMTAAPPRFVSEMLKNNILRSGATPLTGEPKVLRGMDGGREAFRAITDPTRSAQVVVAVQPSGGGVELWQAAVASLTRQAVGITTAFVLDDSATAQLNKRLPESIQLQPGEVRTFAPHVDFEDPSDSLRHRSLGPATFAQHITPRERHGRIVPEVDQTFASVHARRARIHALEQRLPEGMRDTRQLLRARELREARARAAGGAQTHAKPSMAPTPTPSRPTPAVLPAPRPASPVPKPTPPVMPRPSMPRTSQDEPGSPTPVPQTASLSPAWHGALGRLLGDVFGVTDITAEAIAGLEEHLKGLERREQAAEDQVGDALREADEASARTEDLQDRLDEAELAAVYEQEERERLSREVEHLRRMAIEAERYADLAVPPVEDEWSLPDTFNELLDRLKKPEFAVSTYIVFTGDLKKVSEVENRDQLGRYLRTFWEALHVLHDYATAKDQGFSGSVHQYLNQSDVPGTKCTPKTHAPSESDSVKTNSAWSKDRLFPVPREVDPQSAVHMWAHFKSPGGGGFAPRMHYYDDMLNTRKIYVGYIGRHLPNTKTAST